MNRRGWLLFAAMSFLWGIPYLLIKESVASFAPAGVVSGRTLGGALLLLPLAARAGALRPALRAWKWVLAFGLVEMAGPFMLLSHAEQTLPSGLTGLLVSTVPLVAAVIAFGRGDRSALHPTRIAGLFVGIAGVGLVVGAGGDGSVTALAVAEVIGTAVLYGIAPFIVVARLSDVPPLGSISLSLAMIGLGYLPVAIVTQNGTPTDRSIGALVGLAVLCTAIAFVLLFRLIAEVGPARTPLLTYINPVVALALGALVLDEPITRGMLAGIPLILVGCWLASRTRGASPAVTAAPAVEPDPATLTIACGD